MFVCCCLLLFVFLLAALSERIKMYIIVAKRCVCGPVVITETLPQKFIGTLSWPLTLYGAKAIIVPHRIIWSLYTIRWWVGCCIWYSEERTGRAPSPPRPLLLVVPNVTAHPSTASVPITVLLYNGTLLCGFNVSMLGGGCISPFSPHYYTASCWNSDILIHNKKLNYCWASSRYDKVGDNGRSANPNCNPEHDLRKIYFTNRVVNAVWNSVPSYVASAKRAKLFKCRLW